MKNKRMRWDLLIIIFAIWNCIQVPYSFAFDVGTDSNIYTLCFNLFTDVIFIVDVFINFLTTYISEETGIESFSFKEISIQYLKGRFMIDFIAAIPTEIFSMFTSSETKAANLLQLIGILKLTRVTKLSRVIKYLNLKSGVKMTIELCILVFYLFLYLHCVSCFWFYIVNMDESWIPPLDAAYNESTYYQGSTYYKYIVSLYYTVLSLSGNDSMPVGNIQITLSTILFVAASMINAGILGNISVIIQQLNKKNSDFHEKLQNASYTMKNLMISEDLQFKVHAYLVSTQTTLDQQKEFDSFLNILSPSLKFEVTRHIFMKCILKNDIFEGQNDIVDIILHDLKTVLYLPEDEICRQGTEGECLYFLAKGDCEVYIQDENLMQQYVRLLRPGSYFGEVAILKSCNRTATVKSKNYSTCASISKDRFEMLLKRYPFIKNSMEEKIKSKFKDNLRKFIYKTLKSIEYFGDDVSDEIIHEISFKVEYIHLNKDEFLFKSGTTCKEIFIISKGEIEIMMANKSCTGSTHLDSLTSGSTIGSLGSLCNEDYNISGKAVNSAVVFRIDSKIIEELRKLDSIFDRHITICEKRIQEEGMPFCDYIISNFKNPEITTKQKIMRGIQRILRILKSYKSSAFEEVFFAAKEMLLRKETIKPNKEAKLEALLLEIATKCESLSDTINHQNNTIKRLERKIDLLQCTKENECERCCQNLNEPANNQSKNESKNNFLDIKNNNAKSSRRSTINQNSPIEEQLSFGNQNYKEDDNHDFFKNHVLKAKQITKRAIDFDTIFKTKRLVSNKIHSFKEKFNSKYTLDSNLLSK